MRNKPKSVIGEKTSIFSKETVMMKRNKRKIIVRKPIIKAL